MKAQGDDEGEEIAAPRSSPAAISGMKMNIARTNMSKQLLASGNSPYSRLQRGPGAAMRSSSRPRRKSCAVDKESLG